LMSLEQARDEHIDVLRKLKKGINPLDERREERRGNDLPVDFKSVAERWYEKNKAGKSESWKDANRRFLNAAYPKLGARRMMDISAQGHTGPVTAGAGDSRMGARWEKIAFPTDIHGWGI